MASVKADVRDRRESYCSSTYFATSAASFHCVTYQGCHAGFFSQAPPPPCASVDTNVPIDPNVVPTPCTPVTPAPSAAPSQAVPKSPGPKPKPSPSP
jgi:hypothetical protein